MKKLLLALCGLAAILATACNKPKDSAAAITIDGKTAIEVAADELSATVSFNATDAWTASVEAITKTAPDWLTLSPESGEAGDNTLTLTLTTNTTATSRSATIRIVCASETATVTLTQLGTQDEGGEPEPATGAIVKEVYFSDINHLFLTTDEEGRIIRTRQTFGSDDAPDVEDITDFTYTADQLTCTYYSASSPDEKNVYLYEMEEGRVTSRIKDGSPIEAYTYNPDGTLASYNINVASGSQFELKCTWTDGNLTHMTLGQQTATIEYSTETSGIANIDVLSFVLMELFPEISRYRLTGVTSRNLPISCTIPSSDNEEKITFAYEFGDNNAISTISITKPYIEEMFTTTLTLVY